MQKSTESGTTYHRASLRISWRLMCLLAVVCGVVLWGFQGSSAAPQKRVAKRPQARRALPAKKPPSSDPRDAIFYQIFVRSFQDSSGDGIGDLNGIIKRLDYLNAGPGKAGKARRDLGVTGIWLTPIFASPSYHGYDATDYKKINPAYGDAQVFQRFLKEAHSRGIKVILDFMVNHTSTKHPWFIRSAKAKKPIHRDWYVWRKRDPGWRQPWGQGRVWHPLGGAFYYGIFWGGMPDLNLAHKPAREAIFDIAKHWLKRGVDGFRLDAARHLFADGPGNLQNDRPATHDFWRTFRQRTKRAAGRSITSSSPLLIGEVWSSTSVIQRYCKGDQFDLAFHFPLAKAIRMAASAMDVSPLWKVLKHPLPSRCWATFLANHDQKRIISQLLGDQAMMRAAAFMLLTLPGTPFLYYGEEIGMPNGTKQRGDPAKRTPMAWNASPTGNFTHKKPWTPLAPHKHANVATQRTNPASLWRHYQRLIQLRHQNPALRRGRLARVSISGKDNEAILAMTRKTPKQRLLILRNLSDLPKSNVSLLLPPSASPKALYIEGNSILLRQDQQWTLSLAGGAALVLAY